MKKILCMALACMFLLTACKGNVNINDKPKYEGYDMNTGIDLNSQKTYLVDDNSTDYTIVISDTSSETEQFAASELSQFVLQATGVNIPIKNETEVSSDKIISIGNTQKFTGLNINLDPVEFNYDGFIIKTKGNSIFINGCNERAKLYGVYDFLERFVGVKFLAPDATYVPSIDELYVHQMDLKEVPLFRQRIYYNYSIKTSSLFGVRTRMYSDVSANEPRYGYEPEWYKGPSGTIHNIYDYVPKSEYFEEHPEFYASYTNPHITTDAQDDVCYSNGINEDGELDETMDISVAKATLKSLKKFAQESPQSKFFMIGMADFTLGYCECDLCKQRNEKYGTRGGTVAVFMNVIAREMKKWAAETYPEGKEINIIFFAYRWIESPPVVKTANGYDPVHEHVVLEDNIFVRIAPIVANYAYGFTDKRQDLDQTQMIEGWSAIAKNLMFWDYQNQYKNYLMYYPNLSYLADNIQFYKDINVVYLMNQSSYNTPGDWQSNLKYYVANKLYWHPDRNVNGLIQEFVKYYHGDAAAQYVLQYIDMMEDHYAQMREKENFRIHCVDLVGSYLDLENNPLGLLEKSIAVLKEGLAAIEADSNITNEQKESFRNRLYSVLVMPQYTILKNYNNYYITGQKEFAIEFFENLSHTGMTRVAEQQRVEEFMAQFGL